MLRSFGIQTLTGSAQPILGDKITAAFVPPSDLSKAFSVSVGNSAIYQNGDRIILGAGSAGSNAILVIGQPTSTTLLCMSEGGASLKPWPINTIIALSIACGEIIVTAISTNSGSTWLGTDSTVTSSGGGSSFVSLSAGGSFNLGSPQWNTIRSNEAWMSGTINDKVGAVAVVI